MGNASVNTSHIRPSEDIPFEPIMGMAKEALIKNEMSYAMEDIGWENYMEPLGILTTIPSITTPREAVFSSDNRFLALRGQYIYRINEDDDSFTQINPFDIAPPTDVYGVAFSQNGKYFAIANYTTPFLHIYKIVGENFIKLPNPDVLPTGTGYSVGFSPDGQYLAYGGTATPWLATYTIGDDDTFTKMPNPTYGTIGGGRVNDLKFTSDSSILYIASNHANLAATSFTVGPTFTALFGYQHTTSGGQGNAIDVHPTLNIAYVSLRNASQIGVVTTNNATVSLLVTGNTQLASSRCVKISKSSYNMFVGSKSGSTGSTGAYVYAANQIFRYNGVTLTPKFTNSFDIPNTYSAYAIDLSANEKYMAVVVQNNKSVYLYKTRLQGPIYIGKTSLSGVSELVNNTLYPPTFLGVGVATEDASIDDITVMNKVFS